MSKLVVTADYSGVVKEAAKATKENEKAAKAAGSIGREGQKARKPMQDMSVGTQGMASGMGKALMKVGLIRQALTAAGRAARQLMAEAEGASATQREQRLSMSESLITAGARSPVSITRAAMDTEGVATQAQRQAFAQGLAGTGRTFSDADLRALVEAFATGGEIAFGRAGKEVVDGLAAGLSVGGAIDRARRRRPGADRILRSAEAEEQTRLTSLERRAQRARADIGASAEIGRARADVFRAENRTLGGFISGVDTLTVGLVGESIAAGASQNVGAGQGVNRLAAALERNETAISRQRRPALGAQGESAP